MKNLIAAVLFITFMVVPHIFADSLTCIETEDPSVVLCYDKDLTLYECKFIHGETICKIIATKG